MTNVCAPWAWQPALHLADRIKLPVPSNPSSVEAALAALQTNNSVARIDNVHHDAARLFWLLDKLHLAR
jgi:hypothetical protein